MTTELRFLLSGAALLVAIHLVEVMHNLIGNGLLRALHGYKPFEKPEWRERLAATEGNLAKNLVLFSIVVFVAHLAEVHNAATVAGAALFFYARLVHAVAYTARIPFLRAVAYVASLAGLLMIGFQLL